MKSQVGNLGPWGDLETRMKSQNSGGWLPGRGLGWELGKKID